MPIRTRPRLTVVDFERVGDADDLRALLARGVPPDARLGAERDGVDRAPLWIAACRAGPDALQALLDAGCSFEHASLGRGPGRAFLLPRAVAAGSSRARWALSAAAAGLLPDHAHGTSADLWRSFHALCGRAQESHESSAFLLGDQDGDAARGAARSELSELRLMVQQRAGPCEAAELRALAPARLYWTLSLHLEARGSVPSRLAQEICDSRLPAGGSGSIIGEVRGPWTWLLSDAARSGALLASAAPSMDLALDAARARPWELAFARAAGAQANLASEEPLAVFVRSVLDPLAEPHLSSLSGALPAAIAASFERPTELEKAFSACVEELVAAGSLFSRRDRFGRSARARASDYESALLGAANAKPGPGGAFPAGSPLLPPGGHLPSLILALSEREELGDLAGPARPRHGNRAL